MTTYLCFCNVDNEIQYMFECDHQGMVNLDNLVPYRYNDFLYCQSEVTNGNMTTSIYKYSELEGK